MPEGPFGGPRPFASGDIEFNLDMERGEQFGMSIEQAEQELRNTMRKYGVKYRPEIIVEDTRTSMERGEEVEKVASIFVKLRTDEMPWPAMVEIVQFLENTFPIDDKYSMVV